MRTIKALCIFTLLILASCNDSGSSKPSGGSSIPPNPSAASKSPSSSEMGKKSEAYWNRCIEVNKEFVTDKGEVWVKEFRPATVGSTCRDAAKRLRELHSSGVDPEMIDHVNRVIRGFEQIGAIAETKGKESLWRDATAALGFIIKVAMRSHNGAVADGGSLAMGIGASEQGGKGTREGQAETISIANKLMDSEEQVIRHVRKTHGVELEPW